tara:strand:- start:806 stop:1285 length:480 start_codon:yes stop_codon:yes gene_type:complete
MMRKRDIICAGAGTGAMLATLVALIMLKIGLEPPSFGAALAVFIGMILISAFAVKRISQQIGCCEPSLKQLIPVSFLTFLLPILGPAFGAPNSDLDTLATLIVMGAIGGAFWSLPYVLWGLIRKTDSNHTTSSTVVIKNITIKDSVVMGDVSNEEEKFS